MKGVLEAISVGVGKLFALIAVTFPEGSECTCTDGTKTLKAKSTAGRWLFAIPHAATWIVSCTDGKESATQPVEIASSGQAKSVELEYRDYVIHNGVLKSGYTINTTTATYGIVNGALVFKSTVESHGNGDIRIDANGQDIDLSKRSILKFDTEALSPRSGTLDYVRWGVSSVRVTKNLGVNNPVERQIVPIDTSNISSGTINLFISDNPATVELIIYGAWFE